jgi:hypothetical protein
MVRPPDAILQPELSEEREFKSEAELTQTFQPIFQRAWISSDQSSNGDAGRRFFPEKQLEDAIRVSGMTSRSSST